MRYCPCCNKNVDTPMTGGQIALFIVLLFMGIILGVVYYIFHPKKCPECGSDTVPIVYSVEKTNEVDKQKEIDKTTKQANE